MSAISERHIKKVAELIGERWIELGIHLGIQYHELRKLSTPVDGGPTQYAAKMLNEWHSKTTLNLGELKETLADALQSSGRYDLAQTVLEKLNSDEDTGAMFQELSRCLTRDWQAVGIELGLTMDQLDAIKTPAALPEDPRLRSLQIWLQRTPDAASQKKILVEALEKMEQNHIVKELIDMDKSRRNRQRPVETTPVKIAQPVSNGHTPSVRDRYNPFLGGSSPMAQSLDAGFGSPAPVGSPPTALNISGVGSLRNPSSELAQEDEEEDEFVAAIHDEQSDECEKTSEDLNPEFEWVGAEFRRLREGVEDAQCRPVIVALLDSGINTDHPDLQGLVIHSKNFIGKMQNHNFTPDEEEEEDLCKDRLNHGTIAAGILKQYAGSKHIKILNLKVLRRNSASNMVTVARGLEYIKKWDHEHPTQHVDIVLMTLGHPHSTSRVEDALSDLGKNKVLICSAANEGQRRANSLLNPARHGDVIAVGSCDKTGTRTNDSAVGEGLGFLFPGKNIWSTSSYYDGQNEKLRYIEKSGTSFAAPHCAALAALILLSIEKEFEDLGKRPSAYWRRMVTKSSRMKDILADLCHRGYNVEYGHGVPEVELLTKNRLDDFLRRTFRP